MWLSTANGPPVCTGPLSGSGYVPAASGTYQGLYLRHLMMCTECPGYHVGEESKLLEGQWTTIPLRRLLCCMFCTYSIKHILLSRRHVRYARPPWITCAALGQVLDLSKFELRSIGIPCPHRNVTSLIWQVFFLLVPCPAVMSVGTSNKSVLLWCPIRSSQSLYGTPLLMIGVFFCLLLEEYFGDTTTWSTDHLSR